MHFRNFEQQTYLANTSGRPRNNIYFIQSLFDNTPWVMKVSHINPQYKLRRKIDLFLTGLYKDYAKVSFRGAKALYECGIPVAKPLAFWTFKKNLFNKQSYFLSEKAAGEQTITRWLKSRQAVHTLKNDPAEIVEWFGIVANKIIDTTRKMHNCYLRHGDLHLGNFYIEIPITNRERGMNIRNKSSSTEIHLLDYDSCSETRIRIPLIKLFFDLKDLCKLYIPDISDEQLLTTYLGYPPSSSAKIMFYFWRRGGFKIRRRLGLTSKPANRHLKP